MYEIEKTTQFDKWLKRLDPTIRARILLRIRRVELGNLGDISPIKQGISEMRFFFGAGYRVYYFIEEDTVIFLLNGGDKSTQQKDINNAIEIAKEIGVIKQ